MAGSFRTRHRRPRPDFGAAVFPRRGQAAGGPPWGSEDASGVTGSVTTNVVPAPLGEAPQQPLAVERCALGVGRSFRMVAGLFPLASVARLGFGA
jgi:hypothetical protein